MSEDLWGVTDEKKMYGRKYINDIHYTPENLCSIIAKHYAPKGKVLEPCKGSGNFLKHLPEGTEYCEISEGKSFLLYQEKVDWIITNPPFSKLTDFLKHSLKISKNIVFLIHLPALFTSYRMRCILKNGFSVNEILFLTKPEGWCMTGRQLGAGYLRKGKPRKTVKFNYLYLEDK